MYRTNVVQRGWVNAAVSWALVVVLLASVVESIGQGRLLWAGFSATVVATALLPAVLSRDPSVLVAWEVLALSALPAAARLVDAFVQPLGYLAVAALGLLVVAEIEAFSAAEMPPWFIAAMATMTTMTVAGAWAVARFASDMYLDTTYLGTADQLMWELVVASVVGIAVGLLFAQYHGLVGDDDGR